MKLLKPALIAATIAMSGPALAGGGFGAFYIPTLDFAADNETVTKGLNPALETSPQTCSRQKAGSAEVHGNACAKSAQLDQAKHKHVGDE